MGVPYNLRLSRIAQITAFVGLFHVVKRGGWMLLYGAFNAVKTLSVLWLNRAARGVGFHHLKTCVDSTD